MAAHLNIGNHSRSLTNFSKCIGMMYEPLQPTLKMRSRSQSIRLASIACRVGQHKIVRKVAGVLRKRNEVVDIRIRQSVTTVEAFRSVKFT